MSIRSIFPALSLGLTLMVASAATHAGLSAELHKSPWCGCCTGYAEALEAAGYTVDTVEHDNMERVRADHEVPAHLGSCHTTLIEGYVVEGHVPLAAVGRLLEERPPIAGIVLPGMPTGVPGMPVARPDEVRVLELGSNAGALFSVL